MTESCTQSGCNGCGVCDRETGKRIKVPKAADVESETSQFGRKKRKRIVVAPLSKKRMRVCFSKSGVLRFISHLDTIRLISRAIRRAQINVSYTKGYRKRPRIAFGPPLSIGTTAAREYFDLIFEQPFAGDIVHMLNDALPELLRVHEASWVFVKAPSLSSSISLLKYRVGPISVSDAQIDTIMARKEIPVKRQKQEGEIQINIRPFIQSLEKDGDFLDIGIRFLPEGSIKVEELLSCFEVPLKNEITIERVALLMEKDGAFVDPIDSKNI